MKKVALFLVMLTILSVAVFLLWLSHPSAQDLFEKCLDQPMPSEVKSLESRYVGGVDSRVLLRFNTDSNTIGRIATAARLRKLGTESVERERVLSKMCPRLQTAGWLEDNRSLDQIYEMEDKIHTCFKYAAYDSLSGDVFVLLIGY